MLLLKSVFVWKMIPLHIRSRGSGTISKWKNPTLCFHLLFLAFFIILHNKICVFMILFLFFKWSIKFPQQSINQSKTGLGGAKLLAKLYVKRQNRNSWSWSSGCRGPRFRILSLDYPVSEWFFEQLFRKIGRFRRKKLLVNARLFIEELLIKYSWITCLI